MAYTTINKPGLHFKAKAYTGNAGTQSITGIGFRPDLTWIKRLNTTGGNMWTDVVRGATKTIISNETGAEQTFANGLTSFDSDGFSLGSEGGFNSSNTFTSFSWKAANSQGSSNTDGTINSTYTSANTTAGFSIVQYTGTGSNATVGHGLGVAPKTVVIKKTSGTGQWPFGHTGIGFTKFLELNLTGGSQTNSNRFNDTAPTSTVFSIGTESDVNSSGQTYIAYCFAEKKGFSKFGTYVGNGNANGTFIYTGFKPAFFMAKGYDLTSEWHVADNGRRPNNPNNSYTSASSSAAENTSEPVDFVSNGIKFRTTNNGWNKNGTNFIYWAFAEEPLVANVGANGIPATAK
jgi:hypothetical protein